jgi:hypothetical protein
MSCDFVGSRLITLRRTLPVLVLSAVAMAATGGVMSVNGSVSLNGVPASASSAVSSGDTIVTGGDGGAAIVAGGAAVTIAAETASHFDDNALTLDRGSVRVVTIRGYTVKAGTELVTPQEPRSKYEVSRADCRVTITATEGNLMLGDHTVVKQGESATRIEPNCVVGSSHKKWIALGAGGAAAAAIPMLGGHGKKASPSKP